MSSNPRHVQQPDGDWKCRDCDADIMAVTQICSVHDGPFRLSGSGRTVHKQAPYCPNCETKPNWRGTPVSG